jgi:endonuclease YncB( thermonuclease family)
MSEIHVVGLRRVDRGPDAAVALAARFALSVVLLVVSASASANNLVGQVVAIADGDTITVLDREKRQHKIRLAGIDAPEKRQPYGTRSREHLAALAFRQEVDVEFRKTDRYGRIVGKVLVANVDAGLSQVEAGMAWHYRAYAREQSRLDREAYAAAEDEARAAGRGLWADRTPQPPWEFRHRKAHTGSYH